MPPTSQYRSSLLVAAGGVGYAARLGRVRTGLIAPSPNTPSERSYNLITAVHHQTGKVPEPPHRRGRQRSSTQPIGESTNPWRSIDE